jgi:hypothetical protein
VLCAAQWSRHSVDNSVYLHLDSASLSLGSFANCTSVCMSFWYIWYAQALRACPCRLLVARVAHVTAIKRVRMTGITERRGRERHGRGEGHRRQNQQDGVRYDRWVLLVQHCVNDSLPSSASILYNGVNGACMLFRRSSSPAAILTQPSIKRPVWTFAHHCLRTLRPRAATHPAGRTPSRRRQRQR